VGVVGINTAWLSKDHLDDVQQWRGERDMKATSEPDIF
jgi:hypothetical protein